ncbi:MAG: SdrD B-like domain-containing protein [Lacipirellulaceae bacterium]
MNFSTPDLARRCRFEQLEFRRLLAADIASQAIDLTDGHIAGRVTLSISDSCDSGQHLSGIANVAIHLLNEQGDPVQSTSTSDDGSYSFSGLAPGLYAVLQEQPAGLADAGLRIGSGGGQFLSENLVGEIEVSAGQSLSGYDFCESTATDSLNDGPPKLGRQGGSVVTSSVANVILQNPKSALDSVQLSSSLPVIAGSSQESDSQDRSTAEELPVYDSAFVSDFGDIATRPRRDLDRVSSSEGFGSAFDRVREAIVDELFDRVSWNAEVLRDAVIQPLSWLVSEARDDSTAEAEIVETAEASQASVKVAEVPEDHREKETEVR